MDLGRIGIWTYHLNYQPASKVREVAAELEELGYGALWIGEAAYREPLTHAGFLPSATNRTVIATGIANIWARDAFTMTAAQLTLSEAYPDRFLLGLGVSHARLVEGIRGHHYEWPFAAMRRYLDGMDEAARAYRATMPAVPPPRVLAALGPRMLALAAERAQGAHPYLVTPEHTAKARSILGSDSWLYQSKRSSWRQTPTRPGRSHGGTSPDTSTCRTTPITGGASASPTTTLRARAATVWLMRSSHGVTWKRLAGV
jgi:probable F420-dependent oxidoreductase